MIKAKIISSLEKCFIRDDIDKFEQIKSIIVLKNERFSFQVLYPPTTRKFPAAFLQTSISAAS